MNVTLTHKLCFLIVSTIWFPFTTWAKPNYTSDLLHALTSSRSGAELLNSIRIIHEKAYERGDAVKYPKNMTFRIEIPQDFQSIQLSDNTNFNGCTFIVENTSKNVFLFELSNRNPLHNISLYKQQLHAGISLPIADKTPKMLIVKDNHLWTTRYDFDQKGEISNIKQQCYRNDLFFVDKCFITNDPIASYNTPASEPFCQYINIDKKKKVIRNVNLIRQVTSTAVTNLLHIVYQYNVRISNVNIETNLQPEEKDRFYHDQCIKVDHSAKIDMKDVTVWHTYSAQTIWGYAIEMNNVLDCTFNRMIITAIRGGFNTTCSNNLSFKNCTLNRADVHYYGRNMTCKNCTFHNNFNNFHVYNRFSSFYGTLVYKNCVFDHFLPVRIDSEYNAFTPFDIEMTDCTLKVIFQDPSHYNCICHIPILEKLENARPELRDKHLPNLTIKGLQIEGPAEVKDFYYFLISKDKYHGITKGLEVLEVDDISYSINSEKAWSFHDCNIQLSAQPKKRVVSPAKRRK